MSLLKNKKILIAFILLLLVIALKYGCKKDTTPKVVLEVATLKTIIETVEESGKIYPTNEMKVSVNVGALVKEIYVQDGDTVHQGQAIAVVETDGTTMVTAKNNNQPNMQKLMQGGLNPAAIAQAMQQAQQSTPTPTIKNVTNTITVYAPMQGVIQGLYAKKGERMLNAEIAKVITINDWEVQADIGEVDIVKIKEGNLVKIKIDALQNKEVAGFVYRIANSSAGISSAVMGGNDATNYKVFIKIKKQSLDSVVNKNTNYTLRSGMNASITIQTVQKNNILTIPIKAVTTRYQITNKDSAIKQKAKSEIVVFVYNNGIVKKRIVETGIQDFENIEIIKGLQKDEKVVVEPYEAIEKILEDDSKVKQIKASELYKSK